MRRSLMIVTAVLIAAGTTAVRSQEPAKPTTSKASAAGIVRAHADIKGEGITGRATFVERQHLHAVGKCAPDFAAAAGHFDPGPASNTDPDANHPFHMGDLPNVQAGADGRASMKAVTTRVTLSDGPLSLFDQDGSAIIIHGNEDQMITGAPKSGVSGGPRAACGVIEKG
jgi:Cu/Zn superoxide dismutase